MKNLRREKRSGTNKHLSKVERTRKEQVGPIVEPRLTKSIAKRAKKSPGGYYLLFGDSIIQSNWAYSGS